MANIVEVPARVADATASQRERTERALERGAPVDASTSPQRAARAVYLDRHWPELAKDVVLEGFVGRDDSLWSSFLPRGARCARAVARVVRRDRPPETRAEGTAFLISDWVALTNNHVVDSEAVTADMDLEFDYEFDEQGRERRPRTYRLDPARLFLTCQREGELDYTMVAVAPGRNGEPPGLNRGFLPLIAQVGKAQNGDPLNLIHHPAGGRKRVTIRESRLLGMDEHTLHYSGDTFGGSSGAPVLNDQWEVVGLHFGGSPRRDANGNRLTLSNTVWDSSMPAEAIAYEFNVGCRISRLIADARERASGLSIGRELLEAAIGGNP